MDHHFLLNGIKNIISNPSKHWETIHSGNTPLKLVRNSYLLPLVFIVSVASLTGSITLTSIN